MAKNADGTGSDTKFKPEFIEQGRKLAKLGATDFEIAEFFGVSDRTLRTWKHEHEGFAESLKLGKEEPDDRVERALYQRAVGYSFDSQKIMQFEGDAVVVDYVEHIPPDPKAAEYWLNNRRGNSWKSKVDHEHSGNVGVNQTTDEQLNARIAFLLGKAES